MAEKTGLKKKKGVITGKKEEIKECKKELRDPMFVGIDPSYNSFGVIVIDQKGELIEQKLLKSTVKAEPEDRIMELEEAFKFIPNIICLHSVYMEGPSYSSDGAYMLQMGALHYYLRIFFKKHNVEYKVIAPGSLKKFVTGKGNCKKNLILMKTYQKWGVEFEIDDLADAFGLAQMALEDFNDSK